MVCFQESYLAGNVFPRNGVLVTISTYQGRLFVTNKGCVFVYRTVYITKVLKILNSQTTDHQLQIKVGLFWGTKYCIQISNFCYELNTTTSYSPLKHLQSIRGDEKVIVNKCT
jgi:hypothetical protein